MLAVVGVSVSLVCSLMHGGRGEWGDERALSRGKEGFGKYDEPATVATYLVLELGP